MEHVTVHFPNRGLTTIGPLSVIQGVVVDIRISFPFQKKKITCVTAWMEFEYFLAC